MTGLTTTRSIYCVGIIAFCLLSATNLSENAKVTNFIQQLKYDGVHVLCNMDTTFAYPASSTAVTCARSCARNPSCHAIIFNTDRGECFGTITEVPDINGCQADNGSVFWTKAGAYNYPCNSHLECTRTNMECRLNKCACKLGFSHRPSTDTCVTECSSYGSTYQIHRGFFLAWNNIACPAGTTRPNCEAVCSADSACLSWEYNTRDNVCCYSSQSAMSVPDAVLTSADETYYHRDCA